jgi:uroporphyrin-III C-methyltransferase
MAVSTPEDDVVKLQLDDLAGKVAVVGAGPGDPELLTIRAHRLLRRADVVLCDRLVHRDILDACRDGVRVIDVGKKPGGKKTSQAVIQHLLVKEARSGNFVVRLKGGDPFVFGRGGEEVTHLREHNVAFEVVPGVSSCIGVPERAGIPVTHRGVSTHFTVVTGMGKDGPIAETWERIGATGGTVVVLMGIRQLPHVAAALIRGGRATDTPAAIVQQGTTENEIVVRGPLTQIAELAREAQISSPAVVVVGDVVSLRDRIADLAPRWEDAQSSYAG